MTRCVEKGGKHYFLTKWKLKRSTRQSLLGALAIRQGGGGQRPDLLGKGGGWRCLMT